MKEQATRCTQKQLASLAYWQERGYTFPRGAVIPEKTNMPPADWSLPTRTVLAVSAVMLTFVCAVLSVTT